MTLKSPLSPSPMNQIVDQMKKRLLETQDIDDYLIHSLLCSESLNHSLLEITKYYQEHKPFQHIEVWRQDTNSAFFYQLMVLQNPPTFQNRKNPQPLDFTLRKEPTFLHAPNPLFLSLCNPDSPCQEILMVASNSLTKHPYVVLFFFEKKQSIIHPMTNQMAFLMGCLIDIASLGIPNSFFYDEVRNVPVYLHPLLALEQFRDFSLRKHSYMVMRLTERMAVELKLTPMEMNHLRIAAFLHDIGKLFLPPDLLQKQGPFTDEEYIEVQRHVVYSTDIATLFGLESHIQQIIYEHHERYDGSGYPKGIKGKKILFTSSILGVADVYTALQEQRHYQNEHESSKALDELLYNSNKKYDPVVIQALLNII